MPSRPGPQPLSTHHRAPSGRWLPWAGVRMQPSRPVSISARAGRVEGLARYSTGGLHLDVPRAGGPVGGDAGAGGEDGGEALGELLVGDRLGAQVVGLGGQVME